MTKWLCRGTVLFVSDSHSRLELDKCLNYRFWLVPASSRTKLSEVLFGICLAADIVRLIFQNTQLKLWHKFFDLDLFEYYSLKSVEKCHGLILRDSFRPCKLGAS